MQTQRHSLLHAIESALFILALLVCANLLLAFEGAGLASAKQSNAQAAGAFAQGADAGPGIITGDMDESLNWSGYVATGGKFTEIEGTWVVPEVQAGRAGDAEATWVGIGGVLTRDLIQAGTQAIAVDGDSIVYQAWIELLPAPSVEIPLIVRPGDVMQVSIRELDTDLWNITIKNLTRNRTFSKSVAYRSSYSSAEWVEEMPTGVYDHITLADFGAVYFAGGKTVKDGEELTIAQAGAKRLSMVNLDAEMLAEPSHLSADGAGFSVHRSDAVATAMTPKSREPGYRIVPVASALDAQGEEWVWFVLGDGVAELLGSEGGYFGY